MCFSSLFQDMILLVVSQLLVLTNAYKVLIYNPRFAFAHTNYMGTLADTLVDAGLDVTVLLNDIDNRLPHNGTSKAKIVHVPPSEQTAINIRKATDDDFCQMIWKTSARNFLVLHAMKFVMEEIFVPQCKYLLSQEKLIEQLKTEQFDVAITEVWDPCGLGLFRVLGIQSTIVGSSMALLESTSLAIGAPLFPSFIPGSMSPVSDQMTFWEKIENAVNVYLSLRLFEHVENGVDAAYAEKFKDFPSVRQLQSESQLVFTNSVPFFDFPRLTLKKVIDLGGITHKNPNSLDKKWMSILQKGPAILLSFGSVSKSVHMPEDYKSNLVEVIKSFPNVTFIWKHELPVDERLLNVKNIVANNWMPQKDLLGHPNVTGFITHGGANSVTEAAFNGKPMIIVPVFADQTRMGHMAQEKGMGILLNKESLSSFEVLRSVLHRLIYDEKLKSACAHFLKLQKAVNYNPKQVFADHVKLLAEFKSLPELQPASTNLSTFQFYSIDLLLICAIIVTFIFILIISVIIRCLSFIFAKKVKSE